MFVYFCSTHRQGAIMRADKDGKNKNIIAMLQKAGGNIRDIKVHHKDRQKGEISSLL